MLRPRSSPADQLAKGTKQLSKAALVVPELIATEPRRGLVAVNEHVHRCVPAAARATRELSLQTEEATLLAEELEEAVSDMRHHPAAVGPALDRMRARLGLAAAAAALEAGGAARETGHSDSPAGARAAAHHSAEAGGSVVSGAGDVAGAVPAARGAAPAAETAGFSGGGTGAGAGAGGSVRAAAPVPVVEKAARAGS
ncbi:hypothetical protein HYH03_014381 [Edaphochlamys debaryana]|uniref:Uncharacterized protein n=1 Tax=Edaphochlamys debaryana TaxID=47281 RepID=A0A835XU95_9CHLO|nr:hypothetical protein HYH03_014381 [Edaphochlamys debaryana]|eukprot:KAG2487010.1 hypothetical protein HYH03_014381 [Edaphochlamys debaryana]